MKSAIRILVVDDEIELLNMLEEYLSQQDFDIVTAQNGEMMRQHISEQHFDLILMDKNMPGEDGFSLVRYAREHYSIGIIMLTASDDLIDKVVGLEIGADDYITKPFDLRELLARIKSVLRRNTVTQTQVTIAQTEQQENLTILGNCCYSYDKRQLLDSTGADIPLTSMECDLLEAFINSPNRVLSRDYLLEVTNKQNNDPFDRSIDTRLSRLRHKVEIDPSKPKLFKTVRNAGYILVLDP